MISNPYASPQSSGTDSSASRKIATWRRFAGVLLLVLGVAIFAASLRVFVLVRATEHMAHRHAVRDRRPLTGEEALKDGPPLKAPAGSVHASEEFAMRMMILPLLSGALALAGAWIGFRRRAALWISVVVVAAVLAFELIILFGSPISTVY